MTDRCLYRFVVVEPTDKMSVDIRWLHVMLDKRLWSTTGVVVHVGLAVKVY
jgi:hypothetical protein